MRSMLVAVIGLALAVSVGPAVFAQNTGLELHGLYAFGFNDEIKYGSHADDTFGGGASFVFCLGENVKLDLGGDYFKPEAKNNSDQKAQLIPVTGTLRVGVPLEMVYLYAGGGAGYSFNEYDGPGDDVLELEDCFTYHACGGGEFMFNENIGLRGEFRYVWLKSEWKEKSSGDKIDVKFDHMQVRAGLMFYF